MYGILITVSAKRLAQIEGDPDTLEDVVEARHDTEIPGLLDIGKAWDALDVILSDRGRDALLGDAVLARSGRPIGEDGVFESARLLAPARVAEVAKKLAELGPAVVKERYATLAGKKVHGKFGEKPDAEELEGLQIVYGRVVALYQDAAKQKHSMLTIIV